MERWRGFSKLHQERSKNSNAKVIRREERQPSPVAQAPTRAMLMSEQWSLWHKERGMGSHLGHLWQCSNSKTQGSPVVKHKSLAVCSVNARSPWGQSPRRQGPRTRLHKRYVDHHDKEDIRGPGRNKVLTETYAEVPSPLGYILRTSCLLPFFFSTWEMNLPLIANGPASVFKS